MRGRTSAVVAFLAGVVIAHLLAVSWAEGAPGRSSFADVVAGVDPSVVHVTTQLAGERVPHSRDDAVGGGFVFRPDGLVITSRHILQGARKVFVTIEGRGTLDARVVGVDEATDVALLRVAATGLKPVRIGDPKRLRKGDWVLAAGSPFHLPRSWSLGIVSGLERSGVGVGLGGYEGFIQTDAAANVGNSGGPLVNAAGEVVGMMTVILSRTGRSEGVGFAIPIDVVVETAGRLESGRGLNRPSLGVVVRERDLRGAGRGGLAVTRFLAASPARDAGLRVGDVILRVDDIPTPHVADLQRAVWQKSAGHTVTVVFERAGKRLQVSVRLR